jgi:hypothetical protein
VAAWRELRAAKARATKVRWGLLDAMAPPDDEFADAAAEWAAHELVDDLVEAAQKEEDALCVICGAGGMATLWLGGCARRGSAATCCVPAAN